jgi:cobaltochelatase CobN
MIRGLLLFLALFLGAAVQAETGPPRIAFLYDGGESTGPAELRRAADAYPDATIHIYAPGDGGLALKDDTDLTRYTLVVLDGAARGMALSAARLEALRAATRLLVIGGDGSATGNIDAAAHPDIQTYWDNRSLDNDAALIGYLLRNLVGDTQMAAPAAPVIYPEQGFYHPDAPMLFADLAAYQNWQQSRGRAFNTASPTLGLISHRIQVQQKNTAHVDAMVRAAEARGANIIVLARKGDVDLSPLIRDGKPLVDALLFEGEFLGLRNLEAGRAQAKALGVPVLMSISDHSRTPAQYRQSPGGLAPGLTARVVNSERDGMIEPIVIAGKDEAAPTRRHLPMAEQVAWRIDRALGWARLHQRSNAEKRVVMTFWSEAGGKADIGADPDDFLDIQGSIVAMLGQMQARGYDLGDAPLPDTETLARRMALGASNIGSWAPGELARRIGSPDVALLPEARYLEWYKTLPAARRQEIEAMWGPPPGETMVHVDAKGERHIVIPRIRFGNVLVAPHPMWGYYENEKALMSKDALPPHHQYLAFFLWMQKEWQADAWLSLFTNIVLQPGKSEGPLADDHIGLMLGAVPHIHPERLGASGGMSNKRKALAQTSGWYNIVRPLDDKADGSGATGPWGGKILGTAPEGETRTAMITGMLGEDLTRALAGLAAPADAALPLVEAVLAGTPPAQALTVRLGRTAPDAEAVLALAPDYARRLDAAPRELESLLEALEGRWLEPGPMGEPFRRPDTLPPGRALYNFDQRAIPTEAAEKVGIAQAEALIAAHRDANGGAFPTKLALVFWSGENAKNGGVSEASFLHLLGTRVTRNWRGEVTGIALIPREELGRPRVDVMATTSGVYRDHFQDKVALMADAVALAATSPEPDNPVAAATSAAVQRMRAAGESDERAARLASARIFSPAPGAYSPSIQFLAKSGDLRGDEARMAELFTSRMSHAYGAGLYGEAARPAYEASLIGMQAAALSRSSDVNGMLDHPMSAGFLGGLNLAAKALTGRDTALYVTNQRDMSRPSVQSARAALKAELDSRYFNPAWLRENQTHGYDGARTFMLATDHLDLWDSTATEMVESSDWDEVKAVFVDDKFGLDMDRFFDRANPHAQQVMLSNLLGAADRGHWKASQADLEQIATRMAQSVRDHGPACEAGQCRNSRLTEMLEKLLSGTAQGRALAATYRAELARATTAPGTGGTAGQAPGAGGPVGSATTAAAANMPAPRSTPPRAAPPPAPSPPMVQPKTSGRPPVTGRVMREVASAAEAIKESRPLQLAVLGLVVLLVGVGTIVSHRKHRLV